MRNYYKEQIELTSYLKENNIKPTLLLHTCCALCFSSAFMQVKDYFDVTVFFFNPNIYPSEEYEKRKNETLRLIDIFNKEYNLNTKFVEVKEQFDIYKEKKVHKNKCFDCIYNRMLKSYNFANNHGFDYFTTTLTVGRLKDSDMINGIGEMLEPHYKTKYFYSNFKKNKGIDLSLQLKEKYNIYAQNYCGCEPYYKEKSIITDRLIIDEIKPSDKFDYFTNISHDKKVLETFICKYQEDIDSFDFSKYLNRNDLFAIRLKENNKLIGIISMFAIDIEKKSLEIGYGIGSNYWNNGYVSEAIKAFIDYLFNNGYKEIYASFFDGNIKSKRVMEKNNMKYSHYVKDELEYLGVSRNLTYYKITIDEYKKNN